MIDSCTPAPSIPRRLGGLVSAINSGQQTITMPLETPVNARAVNSIRVLEAPLASSSRPSRNGRAVRKSPPRRPYFSMTQPARRHPVRAPIVIRDANHDPDSSSSRFSSYKQKLGFITWFIYLLKIIHIMQHMTYKENNFYLKWYRGPYPQPFAR